MENNNNNNGCVSFIVLEINKTNTKLIAKNSQSCYIIGIGKTDYTIHRDANEIKNMYFPKYTTFKDWKITDFHTYHVFQSRIKSICGEIKFRENFKYKGKTVNVKHAFIGIPNSSELIYNEGGRKTIDSITCKGQDYKESNQRLMYIIEVL
jgi:hypothetical protein